MNKNKGFTLVELLIVIAIIAILAAVVFVAIDPLRRFKDSRDSARWTDVTSVLEAAKTDQVDNGGPYHTNISSLTSATTYLIGTGGTGGCIATCPDAALGSTNCVDLGYLVTEGYLAKVATAPQASGGTAWTAAQTGYYLVYNSTTGTLKIGACDSENTDNIYVTR